MKTIYEQLTLHEGLRDKPYMDSVGKITIGVGRNLSDNGLRPFEIQALLYNDVEEAELYCRRYVWYDGLDWVRKKVVLDLMFNMGPTKLATFKRFLRMMSEHAWHEAADALHNSVWFQQVKTRGVRLERMIRTGEDYE